MSVTTEPPTVHRDSPPDSTATVGTVPESVLPRLFDASNRSKILGVVGVVVALDCGPTAWPSRSS